ncbi:MAG: heme exporter protein CcmB [Gemmatimonadota bacterium]|nr:heme exporter protein CcmB [Gemmatimonadota bacterium]
MSELLVRAFAIVRKDLLIEVRTRQGFSAMLSFAALVLFLFSFAIGPDTELLARLAGGLLWVAIIFTGTLALGRAFQAEELAGGTRLLRLYPGDVRAIFLGKLATNLVLLAALEIVLFPAAAILFQVDLAARALPLALVTALGTFGFSVVGTFFSALTVHLRARELLLPLLLFPALVPIILGGVGATDAFLAGDALGRAGGWIRLLAAYDVILFVVCLWIFPVVLEE